MSFFSAPILVTPLLKVPLLVTHAVCSWKGMSPPQPPPSAREQERLKGTEEVTPKTIPILNMVKFSLCGLAAAESVLLLASHLPHYDRLFALARVRPHALGIDTIGLIGLTLSIMGGGLRIWCHHELGRFFTWQIAVHDAHELVTTGPYAFARHPSYTGWLLMTAGSALLCASPRSLFVASGLAGEVAGQVGAFAGAAYMVWLSRMLLARVGPEDAAMRKEFGDKWDEWARRTPYKLLPWVY